MEDRDLDPRESRIKSKIGLARQTAKVGKFGTQGRMAKVGKFGTQGRMAGEPLPQRDSEDMIETITFKRAVTGGTSNIFPLQPINTGEDGDEIYFRYGVLHSIVPRIGADWATGDAITAELGDENNPTLTATAAGIIYAQVSLADDTYEAEEPMFFFVAGDEEDVPDDVDRVSAFTLVATVGWNTETNSITSIIPVVQGNMDMASCGGVANYWDMGD